MKHIFLGVLAIALMASPAYADGGKKKARKKARIECKDKCCDTKSCTKDDKCCDLTDCKKDSKCPPTPSCSGNK